LDNREAGDRCQTGDFVALNIRQSKRKLPNPASCKNNWIAWLQRSLIFIALVSSTHLRSVGVQSVGPEEI